MTETKKTNDVLDRLKTKEDEMEALINEARRKASSIREEASARAGEITGSAATDLDEEVEEIARAEEESIDAEVARIGEEAREEAAALKRAGAERTGEAVEAVMRYILESVRDQGDEEGPAHRPQG